MGVSSAILNHFSPGRGRLPPIQIIGDISQHIEHSTTPSNNGDILGEILSRGRTGQLRGGLTGDSLWKTYLVWRILSCLIRDWQCDSQNWDGPTHHTECQTGSDEGLGRENMLIVSFCMNCDCSCLGRWHSDWLDWVSRYFSQVVTSVSLTSPRMTPC